MRPRSSVRNSMNRDQPLIRLSFDADVSSSNSDNSLETVDVNKQVSENESNGNNIRFHSRYRDLDPLNNNKDLLKKRGVGVYSNEDQVPINVYPKYNKQTNDDSIISRDVAAVSSSSCDYLSQSMPLSAGESFMRYAAPGGSQGNSSTIHATPPKPLPRSNARGAVHRQEAFYNTRRPPSIVRSSPRTPTQGSEGHAIRNARSAFLQGDSPRRPASVAIDSFDPLSSGQIAIDSPSRAFFSASSETVSDSASSSSGGGGNEPQEDDLLKEWNLDFSRMRITAGSSSSSVGKPSPPVPPPKPSLPAGVSPASHRHSMYVQGFPQQTMPPMQPHYASLTPGPVYSGALPMQTVRPLQTMASGLSHQPIRGGAMIQPGLGRPGFVPALMNPMQQPSMAQNSPIKSTAVTGGVQNQAMSPQPVQRVSPLPHVSRPTPQKVPPHPGQSEMNAHNSQQVAPLVDLSVNNKPAAKNTWETFD